jgi:pilus assembly protein Flp/PilA
MDLPSSSATPVIGVNDTNRRHPMLTTYDFLATYLRARFGDDERGASLVEYALLVALIAVVCIVAVSFLGRSAESKFTEIGDSINE